jgi:hypothetical protein
MNKLTKGLVILLCVVAMNSYASLPSGTSKNCLSEPLVYGGFTFGLTNYYWNVYSSESDYALSFPRSSSDGSILFTNGYLHDLDRKSYLGWKANVGYLFGYTSNDFYLTYTHWENRNPHRDEYSESASALIPTNFDLFSNFSFLTSTNDLIGFFPSLFGPVGYTGVAQIISPSGVIVSPVDFFVETPLVVSFDPLDLIDIQTKLRVEASAWDFDLGQSVNIGCNLKVRYFGGVRYSRLKHETDVIYYFAKTDHIRLEPVSVNFILATGPETTTTVPAIIVPVADVAVEVGDSFNHRNEFGGVGPRLGFDFNYHVGAGFGIVGSLSTSLLLGVLDIITSEGMGTEGTVTITPDDLAESGVIPGLTGGALTILSAEITGPSGTNVFNSIEPDKFTRVRDPGICKIVPNIDLKVGMDWTVQFCNQSQSKITIEAGYMLSHYMHVVDRWSKEGDAFDCRIRHPIDITFQGPYIGAQVIL